MWSCKQCGKRNKDYMSSCSFCGSSRFIDQEITEKDLLIEISGLLKEILQKIKTPIPPVKFGG